MKVKPIIKKVIEDFKNGKTANFSNKEFIQLLFCLTSELESKDKVLQFYANEESHNEILFEKYTPYTAIQEDEGKRAREVLEEFG